MGNNILLDTLNILYRGKTSKPQVSPIVDSICKLHNNILYVEVPMNKKLTLNFAHKYTEKTRQSISTIVEKYFKRLKETNDRQYLSKEAEELYGIIEKEVIPDKKEMRNIFYEKSII